MIKRTLKELLDKRVLFHDLHGKSLKALVSSYLNDIASELVPFMDFLIEGGTEIMENLIKDFIVDKKGIETIRTSY